MLKILFQTPSKPRIRLRLFKKRGMAFFLAVLMGFPAGISHAAPYAGEQNQPSKPIELFKVSIPPELGSVKEKFEGRDGKTIFILQDAHAVPEAQQNIQKLIEFSQKEYGISLAGMESAAGEIDPQLFRSFPDTEILKKVFDGYSRRGELTGGNAAAVFSHGAKINFFGMENWSLYEEGVRDFLEASSRENEFNKTLSEILSQLTEEKQKHYSSRLLEVDQALSRFEDNKLSFPETLKILAAVLPPEKNSELQLILSELKNPGPAGVSPDGELKQIAETLRVSLPDSARDARSQLNQKSQEFQTGRLSAEAYALFLKEISTHHKIRVRVSRSIHQHAEHQKRLRDIEGTRLFEDFENYARAVKQTLFRNAEEKALDRKSHQWLLVSRLSRLELMREDWKELSSLLTQWDAWTVAQDAVEGYGDIENLVRNMKPHLAFYRNAEQRDLAMAARMEELLRKEKAKSAVMIAGGFHAQGLTQQLREKGISYCLIMPAVNALPEDIHYRQHMQGNVSWKHYFQEENGKISLYKAFVRAARDALLRESQGKSGLILKRWRDQLIRDLSGQNRIAEASAYTGLLDEAVSENENSIASQWRANVERFTQGLSRLHAANQITEKNIGKLLNPASTGDAATYALQAPGALISSDLLPERQFGRSRAENRPLTQVTRSYSPYPDARLAENESLENLMRQLREVLSGSVNVARNPMTILDPIPGGTSPMNLSRIHSPGPVRVIGVRGNADSPANQIASVEIFDDQEDVIASLKQILSQSYSGQTFDLEMGVASIPSGTRDMALITARGNAQLSMTGNPVFKHVPDSPERIYNNIMGFSPATPPGAFLRKFRSRSETREIILETPEPGKLPEIGVGREEVSIAEEFLQRANQAVREGRFHDARDAYDLADYRLGTVPYENRSKIQAARQQIKARLNELNQKLGTRLTLGGVSSGTVPGRIAPLFPVITDMLRAVRKRQGIPMTQRVVFKDVGVGLGKGFAGGFTMTEFSRHLIESAGVSEVINIGTDSDKHIVEAAQEDQSTLIQQLPVPIRQRVKVQVVYGDFDRPIDPALPKPDITVVSNVLKHYYLSPDPSYSPAEYARVIAKMQSEMPEHGILVIAENNRPIPHQPETLELKAVYYKTTDPLHPLTAEDVLSDSDESGMPENAMLLETAVRNESRDAVRESAMKEIQNNPEESWQISKVEETMKVMEAAAELPDFHDWLSEVMTAADERSHESIGTIINSIIRYAGPKTADRFLERRPHLEGILSSFQDIIDPSMRGPLMEQASLGGKALLLEIFRDDYAFLTRVAAQTEENPFIRLDALIRFEAVTAFNPNFNRAHFEEILNSGEIRHFFENPDFSGESFWKMSGEENPKMPRAVLMKAMVLQAIFDAADTLEISANDLKPAMNFAALSGILFPSPEEPPYLAKADFKMSKPLLEIASAAQLMIIFSHEMGHGALYMKAVLGKFSSEPSFMDAVHEFFSDIVSYNSMKRYGVTLQEMQNLAKRWIEESPVIRRGPFHAHNSARSVDFGDPAHAPWQEAARFIYKYLSDFSGNPSLAGEMTQAYFVRRQILTVQDAVSDAAQLRLFQSLSPMPEAEALNILSNDSDAAGNETETLRRSKARIQAVQNLWDKALQAAETVSEKRPADRHERREIKFDEGLSVTLDDFSTESLVKAWNILVRARNAEDPQRVRVPDFRNRHLKRFLREVFQIYKSEVYWQDRVRPETSIEPLRRYLDFFMFVLMDDDVEMRRTMIEHLMGGVNPLPGDTRNYDYRHVNPHFFDYVREHLENPALSLDKPWGNPVGLNDYDRERGILNKRLSLLSYFSSGSAGVMKNEELLFWLRPYFYNITLDENSLEDFRAALPAIDLSKRPFELLRNESPAPFMKLAAMFYLESGLRNSNYIYSYETEEQRQDRPPYVFLYYHLEDLMTAPVYVMNGRYPAQEVPKELETMHLMLLTELARRLREGADFSGESPRYLRFLENAVDYYKRTRGDRRFLFGKLFDQPAIKNDPDPRVQQILASRSESRDELKAMDNKRREQLILSLARLAAMGMDEKGNSRLQINIVRDAGTLPLEEALETGTEMTGEFKTNVEYFREVFEQKISPEELSRLDEILQKLGVDFADPALEQEPLYEELLTYFHGSHLFRMILAGQKTEKTEHQVFLEAVKETLLEIPSVVAGEILRGRVQRGKEKKKVPFIFTVTKGNPEHQALLQKSRSLLDELGDHFISGDFLPTAQAGLENSQDAVKSWEILEKETLGEIRRTVRSYLGGEENMKLFFQYMAGAMNKAEWKQRRETLQDEKAKNTADFILDLFQDIKSYYLQHFDEIETAARKIRATRKYNKEWEVLNNHLERSIILAKADLALKKQPEKLEAAIDEAVSALKQAEIYFPDFADFYQGIFTENVKTHLKETFRLAEELLDQIYFFAEGSGFFKPSGISAVQRLMEQLTSMAVQIKELEKEWEDDLDPWVSKEMLSMVANAVLLLTRPFFSEENAAEQSFPALNRLLTAWGGIRLKKEGNILVFSAQGPLGEVSERIEQLSESEADEVESAQRYFDQIYPALERLHQQNLLREVLELAIQQKEARHEFRSEEKQVPGADSGTETNLERSETRVNDPLSFPPEVKTIEQEGRILQIFPKALFEMNRLDAYVRQHDGFMEISGFGLTREVDLDGKSATAVIDFIRPREDKIFELPSLWPFWEAGTELLGNSLLDSTQLTLDVINNELMLVSDVNENTFSLQGRWSRLRKAMEKIMARDFPESEEEVKEIIKKSGAIQHEMDWDAVVTPGSGALTKKFLKRVRDEAVRQKTFPDFTMHHHPIQWQNPQLEELVEHNGGAERFYSKRLTPSVEDFRVMNAFQVKWFEIRGVGTTENLRSAEQSTSRFYHMEEVDQIAERIRQGIDGLEALSMDAATPEKLAEVAHELALAFQAAKKKNIAGPILQYAFGDYKLKEYFKRFGDPAQKLSLKEQVLSAVFTSGTIFEPHDPLLAIKGLTLEKLNLLARSESRNRNLSSLSVAAVIVDALKPDAVAALDRSESRQIYELAVSDFEGLIKAIEKTLEERITANADVLAQLTDLKLDASDQQASMSDGMLALRGALELAKGLLAGNPPNLKVLFAVNFSRTSDPAAFFEEIIKDVSDSGISAKILSDDNTHEAFSKKVHRTLKEFLQLGKLTSRDWVQGMKTEDEASGIATAVDDEAAVDAMAEIFQGLFFNTEGMPADPDTQLAGRILFAAFLIKLAVISTQNKTKQFRSASERGAFLKGELIKAVGEVQSVKIGNTVFDMKNGKLIRIMGNQLMTALVQSMKARAEMQQAA